MKAPKVQNLLTTSVRFQNRATSQARITARLSEGLPLDFSSKESRVLFKLTVDPCETLEWEFKCAGEAIFEIELEENESLKRFQVACVIDRDLEKHDVVITQEEAIFWDWKKRLGPDKPNGIHQIQVGCGPKNLFPDWWNVDIRAFKGVDTVMDVTKEWPFKEIEFVYGEHFLEHLSLDAALNFLVSSGNSLKVGGKLRLTTPNLEWVMLTHYQVGDSNRREKIDGTFAINRAFHGWGHQFLYSREFVQHLFSELGYENIQFCEYGVSDTPALSGLERHGKYRIEKGVANLLVIEATRGSKPIYVSQELEAQLDRKFMRYFLGGH
jgi:predicted SAM-dependent methyltransferase